MAGALVSGAVATALPYIAKAVIGEVASVAGAHTQWNAMQGTYNEVSVTSENVAKGIFSFAGEGYIQSGAGFIGRCIGKVYAPRVALSDASMQTSRQAGDIVSQGVSLAGNAMLSHAENKDSSMKMTALKIAGGVGLVGAGIGMGALAPEVVAGIAAQAAIAMAANYLMGKKPAAETEAKTAEKAEPKPMTEDEIQAFLNRPEVRSRIANGEMKVETPKNEVIEEAGAKLTEDLSASWVRIPLTA